MLMSNFLQMNQSTMTNDGSLSVDGETVICMFYNPDFIIYSSLGSFYIPCVVMIILYTRIFKVMNAQSMITCTTELHNHNQLWKAIV